jgi:hypothetical protein
MNRPDVDLHTMGSVLILKEALNKIVMVHMIFTKDRFIPMAQSFHFIFYNIC